MPYNYFNPYQSQYMGYNPYLQNQPQRTQEQYPQYNRQVGLQGKIVTSIDEVKAIDIPLDGSTSYFALADGSAVVSKQLQQDGKSKTIVYVPQAEEKQAETKYITENDLKAQFGDLNPKDIKDIKEEIKNLKKRIRELTDDIEEKKGE
jgi:hypothetical protein